MSKLKPEKETRQRILEAAINSFQTSGYARTTTQGIVKKAGVAEVTLFRHFGDKQKLFKEVVQQIGGGIKFETLEKQLSYDLEKDLHFLSKETLKFFLSQQDIIRMMMFESIHFPEMKTALAQNPSSMIKLLEYYFQKQIQAGRAKEVDPKIAAQSFMSMIFGYAIGMHPVRDLLPSKISVKEMTAEFVHVFMILLHPSKQLERNSK